MNAHLHRQERDVSKLLVETSDLVIVDPLLVLAGFLETFLGTFKAGIQPHTHTPFFNNPVSKLYKETFSFIDIYRRLEFWKFNHPGR